VEAFNGVHPTVKNVSILIGNIPVAVIVPQDADLKAAVQMVSKSASWRGGDSSPLGLLTAGYGWNVQTSDVEKRVSLSCAVLLHLLDTEAVVDISMPSTAELILIHNTIKKNRPKDTVHGWRFIVPQAAVVTVDKSMKDYVLTTRRTDAHYYSWPNESYSAKGKDKMDETYGDVNSVIRTLPARVTIWRPILTEYWWKDERSHAHKSFQANWGDDNRKYFIYSYGLPSEFQGFISSVPLSLVSRTPLTRTLLVGTKQMTLTAKEPKLLLHTTSRAWYQAVCAANTLRNNAWLTGKRLVTNLISSVVPASAGVMWRIEVAEKNDGIAPMWEESMRDTVEWSPITAEDGTTTFEAKTILGEKLENDVDEAENPKDLDGADITQLSVDAKNYITHAFTNRSDSDLSERESFRFFDDFRVCFPNARVVPPEKFPAFEAHREEFSKNGRLIQYADFLKRSDHSVEFASLVKQGLKAYLGLYYKLATAMQVENAVADNEESSSKEEGEGIQGVAFDLFG